METNTNIYRSVFGAPPHLVVELDNDMVLPNTSAAAPSGIAKY